jgi:hypothetical protein
MTHSTHPMATTTSLRPLVYSAALAVMLSSCAPKQPVYDGKAASYSVDKLEDAPKAVFANQVPVYPGAKVTQAMGSESSGDDADSYSEGMCWYLEFQAPPERVIAFYDAALPNAERSVSEFDGGTEWTFVPAGGRPADRVTVHIKDHELRISEDVQGGRHRGR